VAGSVLAHLLAREPGVEVMAFEKATPDDHAEAGTGLNVGPNALKALFAVAPDLHQRVRSASLEWLRWRCEEADGTPIFDFGLEELADNPGIRIRWSELYRSLREPIAHVARFGVSVNRVDFEATTTGGRGNTLFVEFTDATGAFQREAGFDLVVATDGRYSRLRPQFAGPWAPRHVGVTIYRLLVPNTSGGLIEDYGWWFNGPNRLLSFRVPSDEPDDSVYIAGAFPLPPGAEVPESLKQPEPIRNFYLPQGRAACPAVAWMVEQLCTHTADIHWARLQESPLLFRDPTGRVLFIGDSAHGMVPTLGQGATQAMEDACVTGRLMLGAVRVARQAGAGGRVDVPALTAAISQTRSERVQFAMDFSRDATAAMLAGANSRTEMLRLREPASAARFRRLWAEVPGLA
jgi:salicylate hydroxylase